MGGVARYVREVCRRGYKAELAELGLAKLLLVDVGGGAEGEVDDAIVFCMHVRLVGGLGRGEVLNEAAGSHGEDVERVFVEREVWERGSVEALMLVLLGGWTRLLGGGVMTVVLVWMARRRSLYDFCFFALLWSYGNGLGWALFIVNCMG